MISNCCPVETLKRYQRAAEFLPSRMAERVRNTDILPFWIEGQNRFWYLRQTASGYEFILVNAESGEKVPAFDHALLAAALEHETGLSVDAARLPFTEIAFQDHQIRFNASGREWLFDPETSRVFSPAIATARHEVESPDRRYVAFRRDNDLWLRERLSGREIRLTHDGSPDRSWAKSPDSNTATLSNRLLGVELPPALVWSPDSRRLVTHLLDESRVPLLHYLQSVPGPRPVLHSLHMPFPGDAELPMQRLVIIDIESGHQTLIDTPDLIAAQVSAIETMNVWWSEDGNSLYIIDIARANVSAKLLVADARSGSVRTLIQENAETYLELNQAAIHDRPLVRVIDNGAEVIWFSQRHGWGHLYLYDGATGALKGAITSGRLLVRAIHRVDPAAREVVFSANGPDVADDPYERALFRIQFDGTGLERLTPCGADQHVSTVAPVRSRDFRNPAAITPSEGFSDSGAYFLASASKLDMPPIMTLYRANGSPVARIESADISGALEMGWHPPQPFTALAADGQTHLYGAIWLPGDFDPSRRYPLLDFIYPGPQRIQTPKRCFARSERLAYCLSKALAELGVIVVTIDGRGTPYRSKEFHDAAFLTQDNPGRLDDHVAVLRHLAATHGYIDVDRIGIMGHSGGAFASAMAILKYPDFFKVAVCSAGNYDYAGYCNYWGEKYMGIPRPSPEGSSSYAKLQCTGLVRNLRGKLLLAHGDLDDNVHAALTLQLSAALMRANKDFEQLIVPNANHESIMTDPYWLRRMMDFLMRHLVGADIP